MNEKRSENFTVIPEPSSNTDNLKDQMTLFDLSPSPSPSTKSSWKTRLDNVIPCMQFDYVNSGYQTAANLFSDYGYNQLKIITFSYDIRFIEQLLKQFHYDKVELLVGADFLAKKKMNQIVSEEKRLASLDLKLNEDAKLIHKRAFLMKMMEDGILEIHSSDQIIDHRKWYLLQSPEGQFRTLLSSANASSRGFDGSQYESYQFCDDERCYREYEKQFEFAWNHNSISIPYRILSVKINDKPSENDLLLSGVKHGDAIVGIQQVDSLMTERYKIAMELQTQLPTYEAHFQGTEKEIEEEDGLVLFKPDFLKTFRVRQKVIARKQIEQSEIQKPYPKLEINYEDQTAFLNEKELDLHPRTKKVKTQIGLLLEILDNYSSFYGKVEQLQRNHWKLMNLMFASVFFARLRCAAYPRHLLSDSPPLPLYVILTSQSPDAGKTYMVNAVLKMISGLDLRSANLSRILRRKHLEYVGTDGKKHTLSSKADILDYFQSSMQLIPLFCDEINNSDIGKSYKEIIRLSPYCEQGNRQNQPLVIFAGNELVDPEDNLWKRMVLLRYEAAAPSMDFDYGTFSGKGRRIFQQLDNSLFCEYLGRMIPLVQQELDYMETSEDFPDNYEPDVLGISSQTLIRIFMDYHFALPSYISPLSWTKDYSYQSREARYQGVWEICEWYRKDKNSFRVDGKRLYINLGSDSKSQRKIKSWARTLPNIVDARTDSIENTLWLSVDKEALEKLANMKFKGRRLKR